MNKTALKNFATKARRELLEKVELQARKIGITRDSIQKANVESSDAIYIDGRQLSDIERKQRNKLIARIEEIGFDQVMEETAYTWFNRFIALRFMEVNDYLPTKVRVLSSSNPARSEPDMIKEALSLDLDIDKVYVYELKLNNKTDELFKYLIKVHCNDLNRYMPFMFETIEDYTEILFPEGLLGTDSFIREMTNTEIVPEEDWTKIEIIGWLYQFYIAEEKDRVFKEKKKYKAEEIPYVTQLFTPEWIVRYMVQNALGRLWVESHPEDNDLKDNWEFFIEHEEDFEEKISPYINKNLKVEDIKCFDPAMGSGHILVYMFDVLYEIYSKKGYFKRDIPRLILENNLYGLDIDDRAYQLACFSVVMKAMEYNPQFLRSVKRDGLKLNLASIQETNSLTEEDIQFIAGEHSNQSYSEVESFLNQFKDAKSIGSLIKLTNTNGNLLVERIEQINSSPADNLFDDKRREKILDLLPRLIKQTKIMDKQYDVLVTNPPYMGSRNMNTQLSTYLRKEYPDSKADLFAAFMEIDQYLKEKSFYAAINQHSWMFLSSFEKLRKKILNNKFIDTMLHLGPHAFEEIGGEVVQTTSFVLRNSNNKNISGSYIRIVECGTANLKRDKTLEAVQNPNVPYRYIFNQENFRKIPGSPIAYWISSKIISIFDKGTSLAEISNPRLGMATANNDLFLRNWYEINFKNINFDSKSRLDAKRSGCKWFPYNKGGEYRKWYGNTEYVVDWENDGERIRNYVDSKGKVRSHNYNLDFIFKPSITWSALSSGSFGSRLSPHGFLFDNAGSSLFTTYFEELLIIQGYLSTKLVDVFTTILNPTLNYQPGSIGSLPFIEISEEVIKERIINKVRQNYEISKNDWDSFETSWDFSKHPLLKFPSNTIKDSFAQWEEFAVNKFNQLKENEEELNRIFIEIYGLQDELTPDVADEDVTVRKAELERDIKSFISYAVGCAFGRYSLDEEGLIYAGGEFDPNRYQTFPADQDNILPILPDAYFDDDIVFRFIKFVEVIYGQETLEENLDFIADVLGRKKNETSRETIRRYFVNDFYKDHVQTYKKRPIYWLFTSGKEKAFNCLIYMHRYDKTTLSRIRTDYLHEVQNRYEARKQDLINIIEGDSTSKEIRDAKKELKSIEKKIDELIAYDEKLHHMADQQIEIDLDDGVKVNYEKFKGLVAKL
ncbi:BREX-1 system adenine-specific DNA-methyltransferase PglX [Caldifermentibacillus hisashii]|uniref:BREX-1 system adenine-specific DNA-methyltransferase PglX n=1 Tax=Caldifermentibacillus hisashii TaxID=996558 RepID=UPI0034D606AD